MKSPKNPNPLKVINRRSLGVVVVPRGMIESGYDVKVLPGENRLVINWLDPKRKVPPK